MWLQSSRGHFWNCDRSFSDRHLVQIIIIIIIIIIIKCSFWGTTIRKFPDSIPDEVIGFLIDLILPATLWSEGWLSLQ
jgi:hypothetical protein